MESFTAAAGGRAVNWGAVNGGAVTAAQAVGLFTAGRPTRSGVRAALFTARCNVDSLRLAERPAPGAPTPPCRSAAPKRAIASRIDRLKAERSEAVSQRTERTPSSANATCESSEPAPPTQANEYAPPGHSV
eukprot:scaffold19216_cov97-Isochrysis_galbana.AAC.2